MVYGIIAAVFLLFFAVSAAGGYYMYRYAVVRRKNATDYWAHPEKVKPPQDMTAERAEIVVRGRKFLLENGGKPYYRVSRDGLTLACREGGMASPGETLSAMRLFLFFRPV